MNQETVPNQAQKLNPAGNPSQLSPELRDKIKHPPKMDDVIRELPPEERRGNQALTPQMLDEPTDEMTGLTRE